MLKLSAAPMAIPACLTVVGMALFFNKSKALSAAVMTLNYE